MSRRVVFFPHSDEEFPDEYLLRNWLAGSLRTDRRGLYRIGPTHGLKDLDNGSIVFFVKNHLVVGLAVVEESLRDITDGERVHYGWNNAEDAVFKRFVKLFPESIWAFPVDKFIPTSKVAEVIDHKGFGQEFTLIEDLQKLLDILALLS
jgi:hypothetical protein